MLRGLSAHESHKKHPTVSNQVKECLDLSKIFKLIPHEIALCLILLVAYSGLNTSENHRRKAHLNITDK